MFPGIDYLDDIEVNGLRVEHVNYGINLLLNRLYINMLKIEPTHHRQSIGLGVLWHLWLKHQAPIVPLYKYTVILQVLGSRANVFCSRRRLNRG